jgi:nicotinate-nucleotide pyrophosphorylase (carboxylating)
MTLGPAQERLIDLIIGLAIEEDLGRGDPTSAALPAGLLARGAILARGECVVCGLDVARRVFTRVDASLAFTALGNDGDLVAADEPIARIEGAAAAIFGAERTALNFLGHLSGIATLTRRYVQAVAGTRARIADTRKTAPGLRHLEKYAVRIGGGDNHRVDLAEAILLKDNHVRALGSVGEAIRRARAASPGVRVEVEVTTLGELHEALAERADAVLLDNMDDATMRAAVGRARGRALVEVSGGVTLDRVREIAELGVDRISVGRLTHSAPAADLSLDIE